MKRPVACIIGVLLIVCVRSSSTSALDEYDSEAVLTRSGDHTILNVRSVRGIPRALIRLAEEYGWMVTFEEAAVSYSGDITDMTSPSYHPAGPDDRALDPRSAPLSIRFKTPDQGMSTQEDEMGVLSALLKAHLEADLPGQYRIFLSHDGIAEVVPFAARTSTGSIMPVAPLMDERVSLPKQRNRTVLETVQATLDQVSARTNARVELTGFVDNRLNTEFPDQFDDRPAREILDSIIATLHVKCWTVIYDPSSRKHLLQFPLTNLHALAVASHR